MENTNIVKGTVQLICAKQKGTNCLAYLCRALVAKNKKKFSKILVLGQCYKKYCGKLPFSRAKILQ
jgi:hypothetical protein